MAKKLKVALVHDYLAEYGGAERVLEALHALYPEAPVYTAFTDPDRLGVQWQRFKDWDIRTSWLTKIPLHKKLFSPLRIFAPQFFSAFDLSEYDLVISSTNAYFAKAVKVRDGATHLCYCHTPSRSLWGYTTMTDWKKNPLIRVAGELINHYLRVIDVAVARERVTRFIANSQETARRIEKFYRLPSTVVFPPIVVPSTPPADTDRAYFLYINRLAYAKHPELAVAACCKLNLPLKVVGTGKMLDQLKQMAGPTVEFLGFVPDDQLADLYAGAQALLYPVEDEDFGMVPVEAMAHGTPVIAHASGGPLETVVPGKTGLLFESLTKEGLIDAIKDFSKQSFSNRAIWQHAQHFSQLEFNRKMKQIIDESTLPSPRRSGPTAPVSAK
ncbi:glycosyltransferase [Candidatus Woesebacteria bacterium]|nr:glycosyltransferase [Candidatus Woesebacteria bacterium]